MKPVRFAPAAREEFEAAAEWYESRLEGLGQRFVQCIDAAVTRIEAMPAGFPTWEGDRRFRKCTVQRFPYALFYREGPDRIEVVATAHGARKPGYWLERT